MESHTINLGNEADPVKYFAYLLFTDTLHKQLENDNNVVRLLMDESMDITDVFSMLLLLVLHGVKILTQSKHTIFHLSTTNNPLIDVLNSYLEKIGFRIHVCCASESTHSMFATILADETRDLPYTLIYNPQFIYQKCTPLHCLKAYFKTINIVFALHFTIHKNY